MCTLFKILAAQLLNRYMYATLKTRNSNRTLTNHHIDFHHSPLEFDSFSIVVYRADFSYNRNVEWQLTKAW